MAAALLKQTHPNERFNMPLSRGHGCRHDPVCVTYCNCKRIDLQFSTLYFPWAS